MGNQRRRKNKDEAYVRNANDPKQVKDARRKERNEEEDALNDLREILAMDAGKRFVWRYLGKCGVFQTSFTGNSQTFFNEGKRNIGLELLAEVNKAKPEAYIEMLRLSEEEN